MAQDRTRTIAEDLTDARAALDEARRALKDLTVHAERLVGEDGTAMIAKAVRRNAGIVRAEIDMADDHLREVQAAQDKTAS